MAIEITVGRILVTEDDRDETEQFVHLRNALLMEFTREVVAARGMIIEEFVDKYKEILSPYSGTKVTFYDRHGTGGNSKGALTGNASYASADPVRMTEPKFLPEILVEGTNRKVFIEPHYIKLVV